MLVGQPSLEVFCGLLTQGVTWFSQAAGCRHQTGLARFSNPLPIPERLVYPRHIRRLATPPPADGGRDSLHRSALGGKE